MRTLIYAHYSSRLQNSSSIDDQIADCTRRCEAEGWTVVDVFTDYAISGAAGVREDQRPGLNALLDRLSSGDIDQVLCDSTSRYSRNQGDGHHIRDTINHAGARLFTLADGEIDSFKGAIKGLLDEQQRKELAHNIRRGQSGMVGQGRSPAGLAFGYRKANRLDDRGEIVRGLREIDPDQAAIVLRIFTEYASGSSPRAIAQALNQEGIKGPTGGTWRMSTIVGDRVRQNGMLQNRLYAGELVHNRTRKVVDPRTRRELIKPNPPEQWIRHPAEHLRIVSDDLWQRVQDLRDSLNSARPEQSRRAKHLLSGLASCGVCGGGWNVINRRQWGCGRYRDGRGCTNSRTITTDQFETRVLAGLTQRMLDPALVDIYVREYHLEHARKASTLGNDRDRLERNHRDATARIARLVAAIADGGGEFDEVKLALVEARAARDRAVAELAELEALPVIALHPTIAADYRRQVEHLNEALNDPAARPEAMPRARSLIESVVLLPREDGKRGVDIHVTGRVANMLRLATGAEAPISVNGRHPLPAPALPDIPFSMPAPGNRLIADSPFRRRVRWRRA